MSSSANLLFYSAARCYNPVGYYIKWFVFSISAIGKNNASGTSNRIEYLLLAPARDLKRAFNGKHTLKSPSNMSGMKFELHSSRATLTFNTNSGSELERTDRLSRPLP